MDFVVVFNFVIQNSLMNDKPFIFIDDFDIICKYKKDKKGFVLILDIKKT